MERSVPEQPPFCGCSISRSSDDPFCLVLAYNRTPTVVLTLPVMIKCVNQRTVAVVLPRVNYLWAALEDAGGVVLQRA